MKLVFPSDDLDEQLTGWGEDGSDLARGTTRTPAGFQRNAVAFRNNASQFVFG
jgi:hypothetical protein